MSVDGEAAQAVAAARRALAQVESASDPIAAVRAAALLRDDLREVSDEAADLRGRLIAAILERALMTRAELAEHLGITPQRVSQLKREPGRRR